jgi:hypothetical protein
MTLVETKRQENTDRWNAEVKGTLTTAAAQDR